MRLAALALIVVTLTGCVSTYMRQFVGKDIREVMVADGPPINQFDMPDGRRAFQWVIGGGPVFIPQTTTATIHRAGNMSYVNATTVGGGVVETSGCVVTYFARRDETRDAWVVTEFSFPDRLVC